MQDPINPSRIMQIGMGFMASKTLLSAIKLELFTTLGQAALTSEEVRVQLGLHERGVSDFLDALLSLGFLEREGTGKEALYRNSVETALFLDKNSPHYQGGFLEMANDRLYPFWGNLEATLKSAKPQSELKDSGEDYFATVYADPERLRQFIEAMSALQMGHFIALAEKFDFSPYNTLADIGGASGSLAIQVALQHPQMQCISFDLPPVEPIAQETIAKFGLSSRISVVSGDFFVDDFPQADVITMGNILHNWNLEKKKLLMRKAYNALPAGGALIAIEDIIDDDRRTNSSGLLMSLNMLIETGDGFNFTGADFTAWAQEIGFKQTTIMPLTGSASAAIALK